MSTLNEAKSRLNRAFSDCMLKLNDLHVARINLVASVNAFNDPAKSSKFLEVVDEGTKQYELKFSEMRLVEGT